jgi:hypothetical protein
MPDFAFTVRELRRWRNVPSELRDGLAHLEDTARLTLGDIVHVASPAEAMYALRCLDCFDDAARLRVARVVALAAGRAARHLGDGATTEFVETWIGAFAPGQPLDRTRIEGELAKLAPEVSRIAMSPRDDVVRILNWALSIAGYRRRSNAELIDDPEAYFDFYHRDHPRTEGACRTELSTWAEMAVAAAQNLAYETAVSAPSADAPRRAEAAAAAEGQHLTRDIASEFPPLLIHHPRQVPR